MSRSIVTVPLAALLLLAFGLPQVAVACSCKRSSWFSAYLHAEAVFRGRVTSVDPVATAPRRVCSADAFPASPPPESDGGCIEGVVRNEGGCASPYRIKIVVRRVTDGVEDVASSDRFGRYSVCGLTEGPYLVTASGPYPGRQMVEQRVDVAPITVARLDLTLPPEVLAERAHFEVLGGRKGILGASEISVIYGTDDGMCGYGQMVVGVTYDVFAWRTPDGELSTGACSRTRPIRD